MADREIADELYLSVRTVESHVTRIRAKLGARTRTAAVAAAMVARLIDPHPTTPADEASRHPRG
jgi:DNA-binding CsgD family transcriptional regulator